MEKHWAKNISIQLHTSDLKSTQHFYSVILGMNCDTLSDAHVVFSFNSTSFIFSTNSKIINYYPYFINFEVYELDKLWEAIRLKVDIISAISDTTDGIFREFMIHDNNGYNLRFFEKNQTKQLSLNFYQCHRVMNEIIECSSCQNNLCLNDEIILNNIRSKNISQEDNFPQKRVEALTEQEKGLNLPLN